MFHAKRKVLLKQHDMGADKTWALLLCRIHYMCVVIMHADLRFRFGSRGIRRTCSTETSQRPIFSRFMKQRLPRARPRPTDLGITM